jgi:hypothetical protein
VSRLALGPTQPPIQWVPETLSLGVKWSGHEAEHSPPSSAKVKECVELYLHPNVFMAWCLVKHRDNFTFTFIYLLLYMKLKLNLINFLKNDSLYKKWYIIFNEDQKFLFVTFFGMMNS